jgi:hypothetical protein
MPNYFPITPTPDYTLAQPYGQSLGYTPAPVALDTNYGRQLLAQAQAAGQSAIAPTNTAQNASSTINE